MQPRSTKSEVRVSSRTRFRDPSSTDEIAVLNGQRPPLHPITLRFGEKELEVAFAADSAGRSTGLIRPALVLGIILYAMFGLLDPWIVPEIVVTVWTIRGIVCAFLLVVFMVTYSPSFARTMQGWMSAIILVTGTGILVMLVLAGDRGGYFYYAGLILVVIYAHALLRLRFVYATLTSAGIVLAYEFIAVGMKATPTYIVVNNSFFLLSSVIIGMSSSYMLEYFTRKVFWQARLIAEGRRKLDEEYARKTLELEAARRIQLAMVPQVVPSHPEIDLFVSFRPATEIGGDYYDFDVSDDGTLTFVIGDATGHGARAGSMVTAVKVLFSNRSKEHGLQDVIQAANAVLRRIGFSKVFMALALGQIRNGTLQLVGAGMPPALLYRSSSRKIEEIALKGLPLGTRLDYPYAVSRTELLPGDTLLVMSDGFPELMNPSGELLGYDRVSEIFSEFVPGNPRDIIEKLETVSDQWRGDRPANDDSTFVVFKVKSVS